jgi:hypothetical protein
MMTDEEVFVDPSMSYTWMFVIVAILIVLFVATITVLAVSVSQSFASLPADIDVVIIERDRGILLAQAIAINQNMNFRRNIYILTDTPGRVNGPANLSHNIENAFFVVDPNPNSTPETVLNAYFLFQNKIKGITNVPDIAQHAIFLADQTVPFQFIQKSFFFYGTRPRMFNIFRDAAETTFLASYFTYTCPALVENLALLDELEAGGSAVTVNDFVLFEIAQERVVLRNDFNRDIFVNASDAAQVTNTAKQYSLINGNPPLFSTFHITGTSQDVAAASLAAFLTAYFVVA